MIESSLVSHKNHAIVLLLGYLFFSFSFLFFDWLAFALIGIIFQSIGHWPPPYLVDDIESIDVEILK